MSVHPLPARVGSSLAAGAPVALDPATGRRSGLRHTVFFRPAPAIGYRHDHDRTSRPRAEPVGSRGTQYMVGLVAIPGVCRRLLGVVLPGSPGAGAAPARGAGQLSTRLEPHAGVDAV